MEAKTLVDTRKELADLSDELPRSPAASPSQGPLLLLLLLRFLLRFRFRKPPRRIGGRLSFNIQTTSVYAFC